jgi:hypothetical protein
VYRITSAVHPARAPASTRQFACLCFVFQTLWLLWRDANEWVASVTWPVADGVRSIFSGIYFYNYFDNYYFSFCTRTAPFGYKNWNKNFGLTRYANTVLIIITVSLIQYLSYLLLLAPLTQWRRRCGEEWFFLRFISFVYFAFVSLFACLIKKLGKTLEFNPGICIEP